MVRNWEIWTRILRAPAGGAGAGAGQGGGGSGDGGQQGAGEGAGAGQGGGGSGDGGQQGAGQGDGGQQGAGQGAGGQQGAGQQQNGAYRPDKFPDHLLGASDRDTIDKLFGAYNGARDALSKQGTVPASPQDYQIKVGDKTAQYVGDLSEDPVMAIAKESAHRHGITQEQLNGFIDDVLLKSYDGELVEKPIDKDAELTKLEPKDEADPQKARAAAIQRQEGALQFIEGLKLRKVLDDNQAGMLGALTVTAEGVKALEAVAKFSTAHGVQPGGGLPAQVRSREEIHRDMQDERYDSQSAKYDEAFRKRVDAEWQQVFQANG